MGENRDDLDGFWLFEGLEEEPYGILPLVNLTGKGGPTSTKYVDRFVAPTHGCCWSNSKKSISRERKIILG